ncbi:MAG: hypothetical protein IJQ63_11725, partial [Synergistaceae bacterium]|nr:hypothetical protein [Synergistaceae bacterium]
MANRNISIKTTAERLAALLNSYYAKKSEVVNSLSAVANKGIEIGGTATNPTVGIQLSVQEGNGLSFVTEEGKQGLFAHQAAVSVIQKTT